MFSHIQKLQHLSDEIDMDRAVINLIGKELDAVAISVPRKIPSLIHAVILLSKIRESTTE
jgi:hypothetical protein